jgi:hypothetical protein
MRAGFVVSAALGGQHSLAVVDASRELQEGPVVVNDSLRQTGAGSRDGAITSAPSPFAPFQVFSWGMGDYGCLGLCHLSSMSVPTEVRTFEALSDTANIDMPVVNAQPVISAGGQHSLVIDR